MGFTKKEIKLNTLGGLLRQARLSKNFELKEVNREINIEEKYLKALEEDDFYQLPGPTYTKGFLKRYAEFLELDPDEIINKWKQ